MKENITHLEEITVNFEKRDAFFGNIISSLNVTVKGITRDDFQKLIKPILEELR